MQKYPVTTSRGNEFLVEVKECRLFKHHYEVYIYQEYIGLFKRKKFRLLNDGVLGHVPSYDIRGFNCEIVQLVKYEIDRVENAWDEYDKIEERNKKVKNDFEKWDGKFK